MSEQQERMRRLWEKMVDDTIFLKLRLTIFSHQESWKHIPWLIPRSYDDCIMFNTEVMEQKQRQLQAGSCLVLDIFEMASEELDTILHDFGLDPHSLVFSVSEEDATEIVAHAQRADGEETLVMEIARGSK